MWGAARLVLAAFLFDSCTITSLSSFIGRYRTCFCFLCLCYCAGYAPPPLQLLTLVSNDLLKKPRPNEDDVTTIYTALKVRIRAFSFSFADIPPSLFMVRVRSLSFSFADILPSLFVGYFSKCLLFNVSLGLVVMFRCRISIFAISHLSRCFSSNFCN